MYYRKPIERSASRELNICGCSRSEICGRVFQIDHDLFKRQALAFVVGDGIGQSDRELMECGFALAASVREGLSFDGQHGGW